MIRGMDKTLPEIARDALETLDRNGWCKGATSYTGGDYPLGANCLGGAINLALWNSANWDYQWQDIYETIGKKIWDMFRWGIPNGTIVSVQTTLPADEVEYEVEFLKHTVYIATFNDDDARTEAEVRAVLEKIAAEG